MTIEEMKLAVCEKLPEKIICIHNAEVYEYAQLWRLPEGNLPIRWPTEGLQVCHEAEELLTTGEAIKYVKKLSAILGKQLNTKSTWEIACTINEEAVCCAIASYIKATHEQRLEALCRAWFPERF